MWLKVLKLWSGIGNYVTLGLAVALLVTGLGWHIANLKLGSEKNAHKADIAHYREAQAEYEKKAITAKLLTEKRNEEQAAKADFAYNDLLAKYRSTLVRYQATQRTLSYSNLRGPAQTPQGGNGSSQGTNVPEGFLLIPYDDADICAVNTARLKVIHDWATGPAFKGAVDASKEGIIQEDNQSKHPNGG